MTAPFTRRQVRQIMTTALLHALEGDSDGIRECVAGLDQGDLDRLQKAVSDLDGEIMQEQIVRH